MPFNPGALRELIHRRGTQKELGIELDEFLEGVKTQIYGNLPKFSQSYLSRILNRDINCPLPAVDALYLYAHSCGYYDLDFYTPFGDSSVHLIRPRSIISQYICF